MKKAYVKPTFTKTMYISIENIAGSSQPVFVDPYGGMIVINGGSPCNCTECNFDGICVTECSGC